MPMAAPASLRCAAAGITTPCEARLCRSELVREATCLTQCAVCIADKLALEALAGAAICQAALQTSLPKLYAALTSLDLDLPKLASTGTEPKSR